MTNKKTIKPKSITTLKFNGLLDELDAIGDTLGELYDVFNEELNKDMFECLVRNFSKEKDEEFHVTLLKMKRQIEDLLQLWNSY